MVLIVCVCLFVLGFDNTGQNNQNNNIANKLFLFTENHKI